MRNRITWKGFNQWLKRQKNDASAIRCSASECPVALYVRSVYKAPKESVSVGSDTIRIYKNTTVSRPKIFSQFISKFDKTKGASTTKLAKLVAKEVNKENNIV